VLSNLARRGPKPYVVVAETPLPQGAESLVVAETLHLSLPPPLHLSSTPRCPLCTTPCPRRRRRLCTCHRRCRTRAPALRIAAHPWDRKNASEKPEARENAPHRPKKRRPAVEESAIGRYIIQGARTALRSQGCVGIELARARLPTIYPPPFRSFSRTPRDPFFQQSAQHKKGQRSGNGVGLGFRYGFHMRLCAYSTYLCGQYQQYICNKV
jgi:hypothetical protein